MLKPVIILFSVLGMQSCSNGHKIQFREANEIAFNLPYEPIIRNSGTIDSLIYFFNTATYKTLDFFDLSGKNILSVPLSSLIKECHEINDIVVKNFDTVLALSQNSNLLYILNRKGLIIKRVILRNEKNDKYSIELSSSIFSNFSVNNSLLLNCCYYLKEKGSLYEHYQISRSKPYFAQINNYLSDTPRVIYHLPHFYDRFLGDEDCNVEGAVYNIVNSGMILLGSWYSDTIYVLDKEMKIKKAVPIHSDYGRLIVRPQRVKTLNQDSLNFSLQTHGSIDRFFYDKEKGLYYVSAMHSVPYNSKKSAIATNRSWSILVYDDNWNFLVEEVMPPRLYSPGEMIVCKNGMLIKLKSHKNKFKLFDVSKD
jgi:hypothetical protein